MRALWLATTSFWARRARRLEEAASLGWMAGFIEMDALSSSAITREKFGWHPQGPELLAEVRDNGVLSFAHQTKQEEP